MSLSFSRKSAIRARSSGGKDRRDILFAQNPVCIRTNVLQNRSTAKCEFMEASSFIASTYTLTKRWHVIHGFDIRVTVVLSMQTLLCMITMSSYIQPY